MKRTYHGNYFSFDFEGNEIPFPFRIEVEIDKNFSFTGTVWEEDYAEVTSELSSVKGFIDNDHISFVKKYPYAFQYNKNRGLIVDGSSYGHEVLYDGYWDENTGSWQGDWEILNESAVFHARKFKSKGRIGRFEMRMIE
jgi:hypothetical protein